MKTIICTALLSTSLFAASIALEMKKCSIISTDDIRLECYDSIASDLSLDPAFKVKAQELVASCVHCHGKNWDVSTNGERLVKDMTQKEILDSLKAYKNKELDSIVMNFHMNKYSMEEIEMIAKYISYQTLLKD